MRFCHTVLFTSIYAQIPRTINLSILAFSGQFEKVVKLEFFFRVSSKFLGGHLYVREANWATIYYKNHGHD